MKKEIPSGEKLYEKYIEHQKWARQRAAELDVNLDDTNAPQHFVVIIRDAQGKEIQKVFLPLRENITIEKEPAPVPLEKVVEAIKKYPNLPLKEAVQKIKADK
ncbi:MAG: hypothetical protein HYW89_01205 [Candidatus Sungiibacteriota bacterium]|uniref:Uncharacterized protein n=1 Tax=Candidatus Sungiibacteriota bacterium TaxID=2750080 RepID=A0A7T5RK09_9BACT|nr:MAG: hypothetical protein HYW89_01205 [Candidatus Sungbacteria bacterium]